MGTNNLNIADKLNLKQANEALNQLNNTLGLINSSVDELTKKGSKFSDTFSSDSIKDRAKAERELTKINKELLQSEKLRVQLKRERLKLSKDIEAFNKLKKASASVELKNQNLKIKNDKEELRLSELKKTAEDKEIARKKRASDAERKQIKETSSLKETHFKAEKAQFDATQKKVKQITAAKKKLAVATEKQAVADKKAAEAAKNLNGDLNKLNKETSELTKKRNRLTDIEGKNKKQYEALTKQLSKNIAKQKKYGEVIGRHQIDVGNYGKALGKMRLGMVAAGAAIATLAIAGFGKLKDFVADSVRTFIDFTAISTKVLAVSGMNMKQFASLRKQAKELGSTSRFTATEVASLQLELSKLGFDSKQITDSTEAILDLATATGEDLAGSARVTASVLKQYNKEAKESGKVADIMAKAFSSSALDLEKFDTAMRTVGVAANAVDVSLEETTATLGALVDTGVEASTAGTQLKNVYIELAAKGITWDEAMNKIENSTNRIKTANDLFGKRAAVVSTIIATSRDKTAELTKTLENSAGAAKHMADIMKNNLEGDVKAAQSATEGLQIALGERLNNALRAVVSGWTNMVTAIKEFIAIDPAEQLREEQQEVNILAMSLLDQNINAKDRNKIYNELMKIAPNVLDGINKENISYIQLTKNLAAYNNQMINKIVLEKKNQELIKLQNSAAEDRIRVYEERKRIIGVVADIEESLIKQGDLTETQLKRIKKETLGAGKSWIDYAKKIELVAHKSDVLVSTNERGTGGVIRAGAAIAGYVNQFKKLENQAKKTTDAASAFALEQEKLKAELGLNVLVSDDKTVDAAKTKLKIETKITKQKAKQKELDLIEQRANLGFDFERGIVDLRKWKKELDKNVISISEYADKQEEIFPDKTFIDTLDFSMNEKLEMIKKWDNALKEGLITVDIYSEKVDELFPSDADLEFKADKIIGISKALSDEMGKLAKSKDDDNNIEEITELASEASDTFTDIWQQSIDNQRAAID